MTAHEYRLMLAVWKIARDHYGRTLASPAIEIMLYIDQKGRTKK